MKTVEKLFDLIPKLEPVQFIGLARLLGVKLIDLEKSDEKGAEPRQFTEVLEDVLRAFEKLNRKRQREVFQLVKQAVKGRGDG